MNLKNIEIDRNSIQADLDIRQAGISDYDSILRFLKKAYNQRSKYKFPDGGIGNTSKIIIGKRKICRYGLLFTIKK